MTSKPLPTGCILPAIVAFALFVAAITTENFWVSLALGVGGTLASAYAAFLLREFGKSVPDAEKRKRRRR